MLQTCGKPYGNACYAGYRYCGDSGLSRVSNLIMNYRILNSLFIPKAGADLGGGPKGRPPPPLFLVF